MFQPPIRFKLKGAQEACFSLVPRPLPRFPLACSIVKQNRTASDGMLCEGLGMRLDFLAFKFPHNNITRQILHYWSPNEQAA